MRHEQLESRHLLSAGPVDPPAQLSALSDAEFILVGPLMPLGDQTSDTGDHSGDDDGADEYTAGDHDTAAPGSTGTRGGAQSPPNQGATGTGVGQSPAYGNNVSPSSIAAGSILTATDLVLSGSNGILYSTPGGGTIQVTPYLRNTTSPVNLVQLSESAPPPGSYTGGGDSLDAPRLEPTMTSAPRATATQVSVAAAVEIEFNDPTFLSGHSETQKSTTTVVAAMLNGAAQSGGSQQQPIQDAQPQTDGDESLPTGDGQELDVDAGAAACEVDLAAAMLGSKALGSIDLGRNAGSSADAGNGPRHEVVQQARTLALDLTRAAASAWSGTGDSMPLVTQVACDVAAMDEALDQLMQELDEFGNEVVDWFGQQLPPSWTMAVIGAVIIVGTRRLRSARTRRSREEELDEASLSWLFAKMHGLEIQY